MPSLTIVSGTYGKGQASYDQEAFSLPKDVVRPVDEIEAIEVHGSVAGKEDDGWPRTSCGASRAACRWPRISAGRPGSRPAR